MRLLTLCLALWLLPGLALSQSLDDLVARRVQVIEGDVGTDGLGLDDHGREVLASCGADSCAAFLSKGYDSPACAVLGRAGVRLPVMPPETAQVYVARSPETD